MPMAHMKRPASAKASTRAPNNTSIASESDASFIRLPLTPVRGLQAECNTPLSQIATKVQKHAAVQPQAHIATAPVLSTHEHAALEESKTVDRIKQKQQQLARFNADLHKRVLERARVDAAQRFVRGREEQSRRHTAVTHSYRLIRKAGTAPSSAIKSTKNGKSGAGNGASTSSSSEADLSLTDEIRHTIAATQRARDSLLSLAAQGSGAQGGGASDGERRSESGGIEGCVSMQSVDGSDSLASVEAGETPLDEIVEQVEGAKVGQTPDGLSNAFRVSAAGGRVSYDDWVNTVERGRLYDDKRRAAMLGERGRAREIRLQAEAAARARSEERRAAAALEAAAERRAAEAAASELDRQSSVLDDLRRGQAEDGLVTSRLTRDERRVVESSRYWEALRARLHDTLTEAGVAMQGFCKCGRGVSDSDVSLCASNCPLRNNHALYNVHIRDLLAQYSGNSGVIKASKK